MNSVNVIENFLHKNFLISPDFLDCYDGNDEAIIKTFAGRDGPLVLNKDLFLILKNSSKIAEINWVEFDKSRAILEKGKEEKIYKTFLDILSYSTFENKKILDNGEDLREVEQLIVEAPTDVAGVIGTRNYIDEENKKKEVSHFTQFFRLRYNV